MKKLIIKLLSLGIAIILTLLMLFSCNIPAGSGDQNNGLDNLDEQNDGLNNSEDQNNDSNNINEDRSIEVLDSDSDLVIKLVEYCNFLINPPCWDLPEVTLEDQINTIKGSGVVKPLLVDYEPENCYYVCAYYNCDEHAPEQREYYCASEYTWVKYEGVKDISDNYNDKAFVVAFQINRPSITKNIITEDENQRMDIVHTYIPKFVAGKNTGDIDAIERSFIFLTSANDSIIYRVPTEPHLLWEIDCICLENKYYITLEMYRKFEN